MKIKLLTCISIVCLLNISAAYSQITLISSFNPPDASTLCGIGYDTDSAQVWIYGCNENTVLCYDTAGNLLNTIPVPGSTANDVDIEMAPVQLVMNGNIVPKGQLLFINGEVDSAEIYAVNNVTGIVIDTLFTGFGTSHVVGSAYHPQRNTFFMVQDNVPGTALENLVAEIDPLTGDTLQTFQTTNYISVFYGDIEVGANGNLFVVSSDKDSIAEFSPTGTFVQMHALPTGVIDLSGIALDCANGEAWVSGNAGTVFHLGNFPCGTTGIAEISQQQFYLSDVIPNPFKSEINFSVLLKERGKLKIVLVNVLGEQVKLIYDGNADAGKKNFSIADMTLKSGIYFLKAEGDFIAEVKRVVCIK